MDKARIHAAKEEILVIPKGFDAPPPRFGPPSKGAGPSRDGEAGPSRHDEAELEQHIVIRVHHEDLYPEDVTELDGVPITTPARTLLDLATDIGDGELEHAVAEALRRKLTTRSEVLEVIARYPLHRGGPRLRALIDALPGRPMR